MARKEPLYPHVPKGRMVEAPHREYPVGIGYVGQKVRRGMYERIEEVPRSTVGRELAYRKEEAKALLKQAVASAESGEYESALWQAVDAAGLISFFVHREAVGMPPNPTGRGFFINKK